MVWMYHHLFNPSLIGGNMGCFQFFVIINKAAVNICIQVFVNGSPGFCECKFSFL